MKALASVRANIFYGKNDKDELKKHFEIVLLVDKPIYSVGNEGNIIRERGVEEMRFTVAEEAFDLFISHLKEIRGANESDLT